MDYYAGALELFEGLDLRMDSSLEKILPNLDFGDWLAEAAKRWMQSMPSGSQVDFLQRWPVWFENIGVWNGGVAPDIRVDLTAQSGSPTLIIGIVDASPSIRGVASTTQDLFDASLKQEQYSRPLPPLASSSPSHYLDRLVLSVLKDQVGACLRSWWGHIPSSPPGAIRRSGKSLSVDLIRLGAGRSLAAVLARHTNPDEAIDGLWRSTPDGGGDSTTVVSTPAQLLGFDRVGSCIMALPWSSIRDLRFQSVRRLQLPSRGQQQFVLVVDTNTSSFEVFYTHDLGETAAINLARRIEAATGHHLSAPLFNRPEACAACGNRPNPADQFCMSCGADLGPQVPQKKRCAPCDRLVSAKATFCPSCGGAEFDGPA